MTDDQDLSFETEPDEEISDGELEANQPPADPSVEGTDGLPE